MHLRTYHSATLQFRIANSFTLGPFVLLNFCFCSEDSDLHGRDAYPAPSKPKSSEQPREGYVKDRVYYPGDGEIVNTYFDAESPGLLYRIIRGDIWCFYNSSQKYATYIQFTFARSSSHIEPLGETKLSNDENGDIVAEAHCLPDQKIPFIFGSAEMLSNKIKSLPLRSRSVNENGSESMEWILEVESGGGVCDAQPERRISF
eukprot:gene6534-4710_t